MKPSSSKAKGRLLQQWVASLLVRLGNGLHPDDVRSTSMGAPGEDIQLSPAARKQWPVSIECKSRATCSVYPFMDQAAANALKGTEPLVVIKANRRKPVVVVDAEYFFNLLKDRK